MCRRVGLVAGLAIGLVFEAAAFDLGRRNYVGLGLGDSMGFRSCLVVFGRGCGLRTSLLFRYLTVAAEEGAHENLRSCLVVSAHDFFHHPRLKTALLHQSIAVVASADSDSAPFAWTLAVYSGARARGAAPSPTPRSARSRY